MTFEKFAKHGESFAPRVSIWKNGNLNISSGAFNVFELTGKDFCVLYYNRKDHQVGIKFCTSADEPGAIKVSHRKSGGFVAAKAFFDCYGIDYSTTHQYVLVWDEGKGLFYFDLDLPFGDGDTPEHPHAIFVESVVRAMFETLPTDLKLQPHDYAVLAHHLFSLAVHLQKDADGVKSLIHECVEMEEAPKDLRLIKVWKLLKSD